MNANNSNNETSTLRIGIIGHGIIGKALTDYLRSHNPSAQLFISDPQKGFTDNINSTPDLSAVFIQIHLPTEPDGSQSLAPLVSLISPLPLSVPVFVRSTILPGSSLTLSKATSHSVSFFPEFLTERSASQDFESLPLAFPAPYESLLHRIFPDKPFIVASPLELEIAKYAHNTFAALKVTFFNAIHNLCSQLAAKPAFKNSPPSYDSVRSVSLLSNLISPNHTLVPGPDSFCGYGGKCLPKDIAAFLHFSLSINAPIAQLLAPLPKLNDFFRSIPA